MVMEAITMPEDLTEDPSQTFDVAVIRGGAAMTTAVNADLITEDTQRAVTAYRDRLAAASGYLNASVA